MSEVARPRVVTWGSIPIVTYDGWWGDEHPDDRAPGGYHEEPWETFEVYVHGLEAGDTRPITLTELYELVDLLSEGGGMSDMSLPTVTVTENTPYQFDPNTGEPMRPYNDLRGDHVAPTETELSPGTYALVLVDAMEKVWWCEDEAARPDDAAP